MDDGESRGGDRAFIQRGKRFKALLSNDELRTLQAAVIAGGFADSRQILLLGIDPAIVARLREVQAPGDQILSDLYGLRDAGVLADGTIPLMTWLENAEHSSGPRAESGTFSGALSKYSTELDRQGCVDHRLFGVRALKRRVLDGEEAVRRYRNIFLMLCL